MTSMAASPKWQRIDKQVKAFLAAELAHAPMYQASVVALWENHLALGLVNDDFVAELTSGKRPSLFQRVWEMLLARHLNAQGHVLTCPGRGPDFRFEKDGMTVWVEATAPEPRGVPSDWLAAPAPGEIKVGAVPHNEILLRWTAAFKEKCDKLAEYRRKEIVGEGDAYVIAINGCQLAAIPLDHGISRYPYAVETVFPVGPFAFRINRDSGRIQDSFVSERFQVTNANGSPVPTTPFVDPAYSGVSAVISCSLDRYEKANLPVYIAHNPLALVPVRPGVLGTTTNEWVATPIGDDGLEFELTRLAI